MNFIHAALFFGLFVNFFVKSYIKKPPPKKNPTLICSKDPQPYLEKKPEKSSGAGNTHIKQLVAQMEKEAGSHLARLHSCSKDTCCHLNCGVLQCAKRNGKQYNYCIPESMNSYPKYNGLSVPESLKNRKTFKGL